MISAEAGRLTRLIERLLLLSRLQAGAVLIEPHPARPEDIAAAACDALGDRLRMPGCDFHLRCETGLPEILADRDALTLWHLIARVEGERRAAVVGRLAELAPPPPEAPLDRVRELDRDALLAWRAALPLP